MTVENYLVPRLPKSFIFIIFISKLILWRPENHDLKERFISLIQNYYGNNVSDLWPLLVEERRLEYADGYHDLVHDGGVESVDLLGRSQPASPSHLLSIIGTARKYISGNAIA